MAINRVDIKSSKQLEIGECGNAKKEKPIKTQKREWMTGTSNEVLHPSEWVGKF